MLLDTLNQLDLDEHRHASSTNKLGALVGAVLDQRHICTMSSDAVSRDAVLRNVDLRPFLSNSFLVELMPGNFLNEHMKYIQSNSFRK